MRQIIFWRMILLCLVLPVLGAQNTGQNTAPAWYLDREQQYPAGSYISAVGEGRSRADAEAAAVAGVSMFFNTKIEVRNQVIREFNEAVISNTTDFSQKTYINESAAIRSEEEFLGVRFTNPWQNPRTGTWTVLAYIDRREVARIYDGKIQTNMTAINALSTDAAIETEPFYACGLLYRALRIGDMTEQYIHTAIMVDPSSQNHYAALVRQIGILRSNYRARREGLSFAMNTSAGDFSGRVERKLGELLEGSGYVITERNPLYMVTVRLSATEEILEAGPFVRSGISIRIDRGGGSLFSYSKNYPRYGHRTMEGAYNRAFLAIESDLEENFITKLTAMLGK